MILLRPELIEFDQSKVEQIESGKLEILRSVIFNRKTSSRLLLDSFISSTNDLTELLSIKNAQMEAQNEEEALIYLKHLKKATLFVINEIQNGVNFASPIQLFQLFRLISPQSHDLHPNRFRDKLVQVGAHVCPSPNMVPGLVSALFDQMKLIPQPLIRAIYFHHELIRIHPMIDGNGRVTRIAKNWMLMFNFCPPIFIRNKAEKTDYINALSNSFASIAKSGDNWHEATRVFFDQELDRMLTSINYVKDKMKPISI